MTNPKDILIVKVTDYKRWIVPRKVYRMQVYEQNKFFVENVYSIVDCKQQIINNNNNICLIIFN